MHKVIGLCITGLQDPGSPLGVFDHLCRGQPGVAPFGDRKKGAGALPPSHASAGTASAQVSTAVRMASSSPDEIRTVFLVKVT